MVVSFALAQALPVGQNRATQNALPQNALVTDNPARIDNNNQGQDCDVSVSFTGDSVNGMRNGENYYHGNPGLTFSVHISGLGAGGIASIGCD